MARQSSRYPTELELEILKILWRDGPSSVRHVRKALEDFRKLAHTSVMTMMTIMIEKGYLKRAKKGRCYRYQAKATQGEVSSGMLSDIVDRVFNGCTATAVVNLLETGDIDEAEFEDLRRLVRRRAKEKRK